MSFITANISVIDLGSLALESAKDATSAGVNWLDISQVVYWDDVHWVVFPTYKKHILFLDVRHKSRLPRELIGMLRNVNIPWNTRSFFLSRWITSWYGVATHHLKNVFLFLLFFYFRILRLRLFFLWTGFILFTGVDHLLLNNSVLWHGFWARFLLDERIIVPETFFIRAFWVFFWLNRWLPNPIIRFIFLVLRFLLPVR
jgi:hypothetical protein